MEKAYTTFLDDIMTVLQAQLVDQNELVFPIKMSSEYSAGEQDYFEDVEHWANYLQTNRQTVLTEYEILKTIESNSNVSYKRYLKDIIMEYKAQQDPTFVEKLKRSRMKYYNHAIPPKKQSFTIDDFEHETRLQDPGYRTYVYWGLTKIEDYFLNQEPPILIVTSDNSSRCRQNFAFAPKEASKTKVKYIRFHSTRGHR